MTESGRVRYFEVEGQPRPCAGNVAFLDTVASRFSTYLGLSIDAPLQYHYRPVGTELPCPSGAFGCTDPASATMWARNPDEAHELVHALLAQHSIATTPFFSEGLALALGDDMSVGVLRETPSVDELLEQRDPLNYSSDELLGITVVSAALLRRGGPTALLSVLRAVPPGSSAEKSKQALNDAFAFDFDSFVTEVRDAGAQAAHLGLRECAAPPAALEGLIRLSCGDNAVGPIANSSPPTMYGAQSIVVPAPGAYALYVSGGSAAEAVFWGLLDCDSGVRPATQGAGGGLFASSRVLLKYLSSSHWALQAKASDAVDSQLTFSLLQTDAGVISGCAGPPLTIASTVESIDFDLRDAPMALWGLQSELNRVATLGPGMAVELCADACGSSCVRHDGVSEELPFRAGEPVWLRPLVSSSIGFTSLR